MSAERDLDVALYGATGFVGRLTARYLAEHAPEGARIGLGGRSEPKLAQLRSELGARAADWPLLVADSADPAALAAMAARTSRAARACAGSATASRRSRGGSTSPARPAPGRW